MKVAFNHPPAKAGGNSRAALNFNVIRRCINEPKIKYVGLNCPQLQLGDD